MLNQLQSIFLFLRKLRPLYNMNKKLLLLLSFTAVLFIADLKAQMPKDNPCEAETFCNTAALDQYSNSIPLPTRPPYLKPKDFCGSIESPSWFRFVAESTTIDLQFTYSNCGGILQDGLQAMIFDVEDCKDTLSFKGVSNCMNLPKSVNSGIVTATSLVPGKTYYLLIDGVSGGLCDYSIDVLGGATIKTSSAVDLAAPTEIYGPLQICADASTVTYSIPKNPNAINYNFNFDLIGGAGAISFGGPQLDSFYTTNLFTNSPIAIMQLTVNYSNNCIIGPPKIIDINVSTEFIVELPPLTLNVGETGILAGNRIVNYNSPNSKPLTTTSVVDTSFTGAFSGSGGCDTIYHCKITRLAKASGRTYILKPTETVSIGGTNYGPNADCTPLILAATGDTIYNAKITYGYTPSIPMLNCDTVTLVLNQSNTCSNVTHKLTYKWFTLSSGVPTPISGTSATRKVFAPETFRVEIIDTVTINGKPESGFKPYPAQTIDITVGGIGAAGIPTQPGLINNTLSVTVCKNAIPNTYQLSNKSLNATKYRWKILRGGGLFVANNKDTLTTFNETDILSINWNANATKDTIQVTPENDCGKQGNPRILIINIISFPSLTAGNDTTSCSLTTNLSAISSVGTGTWLSLTGNPSTPVFQDKNSPISLVTVTSAGTYKFSWTETQNVCTKTDTVQYLFYTSPQVVANTIKDSCNANRDSTFVRFNLTSGTPPYNVYFSNTNTKAGNIINGQFQSIAFKPGNYEFQVRDANNCSPALIQGNQACTACVTNPGTLQSVKLTVCSGDSAKATFLGGAFLEPNDTTMFVLHTGDPRTGIVAYSKTPVFKFDANTMMYLKTYYISVIAGDKIGNTIDFNDPCFKASSALQVSVVFYDKSNIALSSPTIDVCNGSCSDVPFTVSGYAPFQVTLTLNTGIAKDTTIALVKGQKMMSYCATANGSITFKSVRDSTGCIYITPSSVTQIVVSNPVNAGRDTSLNLCSGLDTTINLTNLLRGAGLGGTWKETSSIPSTTGAFSAVATTFKTRNQQTGTYRFSYILNTAVNSPCKSDTAVISITLLPTPVADAGVDKTITCNEPAVTIGGNTQLGRNIVIQWSSLSGSLGGNSPTQEVRQADTYTIRATEGACFSTDDVVVYIDTASPKAIIKPLTDSLTCRRDTITIDGSKSTPLGITFSWTLNGAPFENNPSFVARSGGTYTLKVTQLTNGCSGISSINLKEDKVKPIVDIVKPGVLNCIDTILTLDARGSTNGANYTLKWTSTNKGFYKDSTTLQPQIDSIAKYKLLITNTLNGCKDSATVDVKGDYDIPVANAVVTDSLDCFHPTVTLNARGSTLGTAISYTWIADPGNIVSGVNGLAAVVDQPGTYIFFAFNEVNRCAAADTVIVRKNQARPRSIDFVTLKPTCYGEQNAKITVDTVMGGTPPFIYSLDGKVFTQRKTFTNLAAGDFRLYLQDAAGCTFDTLAKITQDNQVVASLGLDTMIKLGDSLLLSVNSNSNNIKKIGWSSYSDSTCSKDSVCLQQWVKPTRQTRFTVTLTDNNGCKTKANVLVSVDKKRPVFIPNIFRPGSDVNNGIFMVFSNQVVKIIKKMAVYDRWGEQVFARTEISPNNPTQGWDGSFNGKEVQPGVYTYIVEIEYLDGETEVISGTVTLVK
jgi:gliding motility-associated-like protein